MDSLFEQSSKVSIGFLACNKTTKRRGTKENPTSPLSSGLQLTLIQTLMNKSLIYSLYCFYRKVCYFMSKLIKCVLIIKVGF